MRTFKFIAVILFLFIFGSVSSAGEYEKLTEEQKSELVKGEAVYEYVKEMEEDGTHSGYARSMVLMKKPLDEAWEIFCDFGKSHEYFPRQTETEVLESGTTSALIKKVFEFYVVDISYYIKYDIDRKDGIIRYDLDKSRPHDLEEVQGYFRFEEIDKDTTLFIYGVTRTETGLKVPGFIQNYITSRDLPNVAIHIKKRIESGGTWKKD